MRLAGALLAVVLLSGCSGGDEQAAEADAPEATAAALTPEGELIECSVGGARWFLKECAVEQAEDEGKTVLVVHHPDGGFRRFEVLTDGRGLAVADGAEEAYTEVVSGRLDVSVGSDRYRFPATIRSDGAE